jgi:hypothetical protein
MADGYGYSFFLLLGQDRGNTSHFIIVRIRMTLAQLYITFIRKQLAKVPKLTAAVSPAKVTER